MPIAVGETFERYEIESLIGRGGMGEVYRATDTRLRRKVALKILRPGRGSDDSVARLFREARAAAALTHPNTISIHDIGEAEGIFYIVMELVTGQPLLAYVGDSGVPAARKLAWLGDVARALAAAHKAGLVHRDVKPSNVMISDDDVVKVLDFGLARPSEPVSFRTKAGHVVGTPRYMAPEQLSGAEVDARADQYAFGLTAYELLAGRHPGGAIAGPSPAPLLHVAVPEISPAVAAVVARTMSSNPELRYPTMDDVVVALEDAAAGRAPRDLATTMAAPGSITAVEVTSASEHVVRTVRFGSPEVNAPITKPLTTPVTAPDPAADEPRHDVVATRPPDTAAIPTESSPTFEAAPDAARRLDKTVPMGVLSPDARAQVARAATPAMKTLMAAGNVPPPPPTPAPRAAGSDSIIAAPKPTVAEPAARAPRPGEAVVAMAPAAPAKTPASSPTTRPRSRLTLTIVAITVLGVCAFAGTYLGSRTLADRAKGVGISAPTVTASAAVTQPSSSSALATATSSPALPTPPPPTPSALAPSANVPHVAPQPTPTPTPTPRTNPKTINMGF